LKQSASQTISVEHDCDQGGDTMPNKMHTRSAHNHDIRKAKAEPTVRQQDLLDALVAACAIVAYADGRADDRERRRLLGMMRRIPLLEGFSRDDLAEEFARHERAFEADPAQAREQALATIATLKPNTTEMRTLLSSCDDILRADGVAHPLEYEALSAIGRALDS
jgi:tellurite resistance protein